MLIVLLGMAVICIFSVAAFFLCWVLAVLIGLAVDAIMKPEKD